VPLYQLITFLFNVFELLLLARILSSFVQVDPNNPIMRFIYNTTEPFLAPARRLVARYAPNLGMDISPIVVLIIATIIRQLLFSVAAAFIVR